MAISYPTQSVQDKRAHMRRWAASLALWDGDITLPNDVRAQLAWDLLIVLADNADEAGNEGQTH